MRRKKAETDAITPSYALEPPLTPEDQEETCINLAYELVGKRLLEGTASSQETVHFLKLGSQKERLEKQKLEEEVKLLTAKTKYLESQEVTTQLLEEVVRCMKEYSGES